MQPRDEWRPCKFIANDNYDKRYSLRRGAKADGVAGSLLVWLATVVLTITTDFHHMRFLGLFTVFATILAPLFGRAITGGMRTF